MFVIYLENYPEQLRGKLKIYLYEIKPALYVGTTSTRIRDMIWDEMILTCHNVNALLLYPDNNEQGFSVKTFGETKRKVQNFDGLLSVVTSHDLTCSLLKSKDSNKQLISHFYETAITTECLLNSYFSNLLKQIARETKEDIDNLKLMLLFFSFLHDIGKVHPAFQYKLIPDILDDLHYPRLSIYEGFRHEIYSEKILNDFLYTKFGKIHSRNLMMLFTKAIKCHHQGKQANYCSLPEEKRQIWECFHQELIDEAITLFPFQESNTIVKEFGNGIFELIVGIINTSDWLASTQVVFDDKELYDFQNKDEYLNHLREQCYLFLNHNLMSGTTIGEMFDKQDIWKLLIGEFAPRPMQSVVETFVNNDNEPSLLFIEDSCGGGKTEAAIYYALTQAQKANGIYFALPTTATSENMRRRVDTICKKGIEPNFKVPVYNSMAWMQEEDVKLDSDWWQNDAKLKLFYPIAVGTVDQLLMTVQGVKYSDLGLVALSNKVLIIDEMHAYDAYMLEELKLLFSYCSLMGISIIVLSATLTTETKKQLTLSYNRAKESNTIKLNNNEVTYGELNLSQEYPLVTKITTNTIEEKVVITNSQKSYTYEMFDVDSNNQCEAICSTIDKLIHNGGTVAVVFNTIAQAIDMYTYALNKYKTQDVDIDLLHSRFSLQDKCDKTNNILLKYGKNRNQRPKRGILISTQIIEQSLDVDFDYMITEIAPIDLIIQRFGRVRRHDDIGTIRENRTMSGPSVFVFSNINNFGKSAYVYEKQILQSTQDYLHTKSSICAPTDIRDAVETVYQKENINLLKRLNMTQKANLYTIGTANCTSFWRFTHLSELRNDPHTRLESTPNTNIILLKDEQVGINFSHDEIKQIIKTQMFSSIPLNKINTLECITTGNSILDEYYVVLESQMQVSNELGLII